MQTAYSAECAPGILLFELFVDGLDVLEVVVPPDQLLLQPHGGDAVLGEEVRPAQGQQRGGGEGGGVVGAETLLGLNWIQ